MIINDAALAQQSEGVLLEKTVWYIRDQRLVKRWNQVKSARLMDDLQMTRSIISPCLFHPKLRR